MSDEFYHELSVAHPSLPRFFYSSVKNNYAFEKSYVYNRSYKVKMTRKELSETFNFERLPGSHHGAYRALRPFLSTILSHEVSFHTLF